jgi:hypothetical protein
MSGYPSSEIPLIHGTQIVTCPKCNAEFELGRSIRPHIDESGFESYDLECVTCAASLHGIIDPSDDKLLLSETESQNWTTIAEGLRKLKLPWKDGVIQLFQRTTCRRAPRLSTS